MKRLCLLICFYIYWLATGATYAQPLSPTVTARLDSLMAQSDLQPALNMATQYYTTTSATADSVYAHFLYQYGWLLLKNYQYEKSYSLLLAADSLYAALPTQHLFKRGKVHYSLGSLADDTTALNYLQRALSELAQSVGRLSADYIAAKNMTANKLMHAGKYTLAEQEHLECIALRQQFNPNDYGGLARSYNNLGLLYRSLGNYPKAEERLRESVLCYQNNQDTSNNLYLATLNNLSTIYQLMGNYKKSIAINQQSLDNYERLGRVKNLGYAQTLMVKGILCKLTKDFPNALLYLDKSAAVYTQHLSGNDHDLYDIATHRAEILLEQQQLDTASRLINHTLLTLQNATQDLSNDHRYLTNLLLKSKIYTQQQRLDSAEYILHDIVQQLHQKGLSNNPTARQLVFALASVNWQRQHSAEAVQQFAALYENLRQETARDFPHLSDNERLYYVAKRNPFYEDIIALLPQGDTLLTPLVFNNRLLTKGILLNAYQQLQNQLLQSNDAIIRESYQQLIDLRRQLSFAYGLSKAEQEQLHVDVTALEATANDIEISLSKSSASFAKLTAQATTDWQTLQQSLRKDEAAIEIVRLQTPREVRYMALLLTAEHPPRCVPLGAGDDLETLSYEFYTLLVTDRDTNALPGTDAYEAYWQALAPYLAQKTRLYVSLDGIYNKININTLYDGTQYLMEKYDVVLLTNLKELTQRQPATAFNRLKAVLVGNPLFSYTPATPIAYSATDDLAGTLRVMERSGSVRLYPLPGTEQEIATIDTLLTRNGVQTHVLRGAAATEEAIKALSKPSILHIATHGYFLDNENRGAPGLSQESVVRNPLLRSMLFFSGAQNTIDAAAKPLDREDGILTAFDVMQLPMHQTELVVLSACQTALGNVLNGEGVYGLQRAFKAAGANTLIMSLWNVDDAATQLLMTSFYDYWLQTHDKRLAFKKAQEKLKSSYKNPYFWGAFIML